MQGPVAVLLRATVVSMVPAAPLLPTTEPCSAAVAHRAVPADVVGEPPVEEVVEVVDLAVVVGPELVVEGADVDDVDEPDEHAPSATPAARNATTRPPKRCFMIALLRIDGRPRP